VLCDNGCEALFTAEQVSITRQGKTIMTGQRQAPGLWYVHLQQPKIKRGPAKAISGEPATTITTGTTHQHHTDTANVIIDTKTQSELMQYLHAAAFSPSVSTFTTAITKGFFTTWPGLTTEAINKSLPKSMATAMGHLDQARKTCNPQNNKNKHQQCPQIRTQ
jgi:hypothetical protein